LDRDQGVAAPREAVENFKVPLSAMPFTKLTSITPAATVGGDRIGERYIKHFQ